MPLSLVAQISCDELIEIVEAKDFGMTYYSMDSDAINHVSFHQITDNNYQYHYYAIVQFKGDFFKKYIYKVDYSTESNYSFNYLNSAGTAFWNYIQPYSKVLGCGNNSIQRNSQNPPIYQQQLQNQSFQLQQQHQQNQSTLLEQIQYQNQLRDQAFQLQQQLIKQDFKNHQLLIAIREERAKMQAKKRLEDNIVRRKREEFMTKKYEEAKYKSLQNLQEANNQNYYNSDNTNRSNYSLVNNSIVEVTGKYSVAIWEKETLGCDKIGRIPLGESVLLIQKGNNRSKVKYKNWVGYITNENIKANTNSYKSDNYDTLQETNYSVQTIGNHSIAIWEKESLGCDKIGRVPVGIYVKLLRKGEARSKIIYKNLTGFIPNENLNF